MKGGGVYQQQPLQKSTDSIGNNEKGSTTTTTTTTTTSNVSAIGQQSQNNQPINNTPTIIQREDVINMIEIGEGCSSKVFSGELSGDKVAVKQFNDLANQLDIDNEYTILNKLKHPNIVRFIGKCTGYPTQFVFEYLPLGAIHSIIHQHTIEIKKIRKLYWLLDIAKALGYMHSFNPPLIHGDVKPENVLLSEDSFGNEIVKLCDFGFTIFNNDSNEIKPNRGTPVYVAPEVEFKKYDEKADVYSFGTLAWEVSERKNPEDQPFNGDTRPFDFPESTSISYVELVNSCWCDPVLRPSFESIIQTLEKMIKEERNIVK